MDDGDKTLALAMSKAKKELKEISGQLRKASALHQRQAERVDKILEGMSSTSKEDC